MKAENPLTGKTSSSQEPKYVAFAADNEIRDEDVYLIESLSTFPKNLLIHEMHNYFDPHGKVNSAELERMVNDSGEEEPRKELFRTFLELSRRYDALTLYKLVRFLEK